MKKIILPLALLATLAACKKEDASGNSSLENLIKNKDIKGLQAYKEKEKAKMDSLNNVMSEIDKNLSALGVTATPAGFVSVQKLQQTVFTHNVEIQGNVTTDQDVTIRPQSAGVLALFVKEGQRVNRGQIIGRVADAALNDSHKQALIQVSVMNAQLQSAKTDANLKKIAYEKQASLWKQKIGSEFQYLQAKAAYDAAQKQVLAAQNTVSATQKAADAIKSNLAKTAIVAPFSGVIDKVITQNGQVVSPGQSDIVKLISLGIMRVEAKVPEMYLANIRQGTGVEIFIPTLNKTFKSSVKLVGNYIDPATRTFIIQIPVPNDGGNVKPNLLAQVKIQDYLNASAIQVPSQYIYEDAAHRNYVFVATNISGENAVAKKIFIEEGEKSSNSVEITSGLKTGDIVILDGSKNLTEGQKIKLSYQP